MAAQPGSDASSPSTTSAAGVVLVHVTGAVHQPGVVSLPPGSRVVDAVDAAGGLLRRADPSAVNLARVLQDGEQLVVPRRGSASRPASGTVAPPTASAPGAATPGIGGGASGPGITPVVFLSTATVTDLDALPGIGPVLAERIVAWRDANGGFASVEELLEVSGIGEVTLAELRPFVRP
jgi:competence protein ComEA